MHSKSTSPLRVEECRKLIHAADQRSPRHGFTAFIIAHTGLTSDEVARFKPHWFDQTNHLIQVPSEQNGWKPKSPNRSRTIPLSSTATEHLARYIDDLNDDAFSVTPRTIYNRLKVASEDAGISQATPLQLRITFGLQLENLGVPYHLVMQLLGGSISADYFGGPSRDIDPDAFSPIYGDLNLEHTFNSR